MKSGTYKHTEETRRKISAALRGRSRPETKEQRRGKGNPNWKGGTKRSADGYVLILAPNHPFAQKKGYVKRSRLIMEAHLGRVLLPSEVVHHINRIKEDDRTENLMLFSDEGKHQAAHVRNQERDERGRTR